MRHTIPEPYQTLLLVCLLTGIIFSAVAGLWCASALWDMLAGRWIKRYQAYKHHDALVKALYAYFTAKTRQQDLRARKLAEKALFDSRPYLLMTWGERVQELNKLNT